MECKTKKFTSPILIATASIGVGIILSLTNVIIPLLVERVTSSTEKLSYVLIVASAAQIIAPYISGLISDRTNTKFGKRKPVVLVTSIITCIALYFLGVSNTYIEIFIFAAIMFLGINFYAGAYYAWMPESVESGKIGSVNGWSKLFSNLGGIIIFGVGVTLLDISIQLPLILTIAIFMFFTLMIVIKVKEKPELNDNSIENKNVREKNKFNFDFIKNKNAMLLFIATFFAEIYLGLIMPYLVPYFKKMNNFSSNEVSLALMVLSFVGLTGIFFGVICDKFDKRKVLMVSIAVEIVGFIVAMFITSVAGLWAFTIIDGLGVIMFMTTLYATVPYVTPKGKLGEYMGMCLLIGGVASMIGNFLGGYMIGSQYITLIFPLCIVFAAISIFVILFGKIKLNNNIN